MMGMPQNDRTDVFWQSDLDESANELVKIILEIKPRY
jgi:N-acetyl-1-D-myo-inositol-2-amino-2-deoxy-alpha-D-glucopyranoside deacetylase